MNIRKPDNLKIANANTIKKEFSNSNPNLRKDSSNIQLQGDRYQNLLQNYRSVSKIFRTREIQI